MHELVLRLPESLVEAVSEALVDELDALSVSVADADAGVREPDTRADNVRVSGPVAIAETYAASSDFTGCPPASPAPTSTTRFPRKSRSSRRSRSRASRS